METLTSLATLAGAAGGLASGSGGGINSAVPLLDTLHKMNGSPELPRGTQKAMGALKIYGDATSMKSSFSALMSGNASINDSLSVVKYGMSIYKTMSQIRQEARAAGLKRKTEKREADLAAAELRREQRKNEAAEREANIEAKQIRQEKTREQVLSVIEKRPKLSGKSPALLSPEESGRAYSI